jgi:hypothetical protein
MGRLRVSTAAGQRMSSKCSCAFSDLSAVCFVYRYVIELTRIVGRCGLDVVVMFMIIALCVLCTGT